MHWDGDYLPDPIETAVLAGLFVIGPEDLPDIAARWLASDVIDTEAVRELAGESPRETSSAHALMNQVVVEVQTSVPDDADSRKRILFEWVTLRWLEDKDTRRAVETLARVGRSEPDLDLGEFIGLVSEWAGGWGRPAAETEVDAAETLRALCPDLADSAERLADEGSGR